MAQEMVYEWGRTSFPVDPDVAGKELERIALKEGGAASSAGIVKAARPKTAKLHDAFEWDDKVAGEQYRKYQARNLANSLVVVTKEGPAAEKQRRPAFYHVNFSRPINVAGDEEVVTGYQPVALVEADPAASASAEEELLAMLYGLQRRHNGLGVFSPVWDALEQVAKKIETNK